MTLVSVCYGPLERSAGQQVGEPGLVPFPADGANSSRLFRKAQHPISRCCLFVQICHTPQRIAARLSIGQQCGMILSEPVSFDDLQSALEYAYSNPGTPVADAILSAVEVVPDVNKAFLIRDYIREEPVRAVYDSVAVAELLYRRRVRRRLYTRRQVFFAIATAAVSGEGEEALEHAMEGKGPRARQRVLRKFRGIKREVEERKINAEGLLVQALRPRGVLIRLTRTREIEGVI